MPVFHKVLDPNIRFCLILYALMCNYINLTEKYSLWQQGYVTIWRKNKTKQIIFCYWYTIELFSWWLMVQLYLFINFLTVIDFYEITVLPETWMHSLLSNKFRSIWCLTFLNKAEKAFFAHSWAAIQQMRCSKKNLKFSLIKIKVINVLNILSGIINVLNLEVENQKLQYNLMWLLSFKRVLRVLQVCGFRAVRNQWILLMNYDSVYFMVFML